MNEFMKNRNNQLFAMVVVIFVLLLFRLASLTIVEGAQYAEISENVRIKEMPVTAWRGEISDRNGALLAGTVPSFAVKLIISEMPKENLEKTAVALMDILDEKGEQRIAFPIAFGENGKFEYSYDREIATWRESNQLSDAEDAQTAFDMLRTREEIDEELSVYEAQNLLRYKGITPPISVKSMKFLAQMKKEEFLKSYGLENVLSAEDAYDAIWEYYKLDDKYSTSQSLDIMAVRNAIKKQGYRKYQPITLAGDISEETAILIEEKGMHLPGIDVEIEPIRYYPEGELAAHVLGYLGKISTELEIERYVDEMGYSPNAFIGKTGIEKSYETLLKGQNGSKKVEVDVYGQLISEISEEQPIPGKDIVLTIDAGLQKTAEDALEKVLQRIQTKGVYESPWGDYTFGEQSPNADSGAAVAIDVNSGEILAMANFPSYDPNLFTTGINQSDWNNLQPVNPRNPLAARPMYNIAALTAVQPGSTFKMITGLAALEMGLNPYESMYSDGRIELADRDFGCWIWNDYHAKHGLTNLIKAIEVSCNYYFYSISVGYDFYKDRPMDFEMNVETMLDYAKKFGLGENTGIEIEEAAYGVPDPAKEIANKKYYLKLKLKAVAEEYFEAEIFEDEEKLDEIVKVIADWAEENPSRGEIISRLLKIGIRAENVENSRLAKAEDLADLIKYSYFNQIAWDVGDTFNLAIGQGGHTYTSLQMARYVSAIANGGTLYDLTLDIENSGNGAEIDLKDSGNIAYIREGMQEVTSGDEGTARTLFADFPVKVGAKTGTAQKQGKIPPSDEVEYFKQHFKEYNSYLGDLSALGKYEGKVIELAAMESLVDDITKERNEEITVLEKAGQSEKIAQKVRSGYLDDGVIWRKALDEYTDGALDKTALDSYKEDYKSFAWFVAFAPYENPRIAVAVLLFQGAHGGYAAPVARDMIAEYLELEVPVVENLDMQDNLQGTE
jgi:penicillin-binding protein 2